MTSSPRSRPIEFEARGILESLGLYTLRFSGTKSPVNLVGICEGEVVLVKVRRERLPPGDIRDVNARFSRDLDMLRRIGGPRCCKKELWIFSRREGFRFFEVFPGGLMEIQRAIPSIPTERGR
ncbi:MAG: hypothetical protein NQU46_07355 [Methanolinea sp.]|nr:hypothetical protein [Methanolinea sp.]